MRIEHWRFEDGLPKEQLGLFQPDPIKRGYYCWVYTKEGDNFEKWMEQTFGDDESRAEWDFRFNSGNPMITVQIWNDADATLFRLKWGNND